MARVHNALPQGVLSAALTLVVGDDRSEGALERYGETLTPVIDLWARPEFALPRGEVLFSQICDLPAVAAEFGGSAVINPVNSGLIALVYGEVGGGPMAVSFGLALEAAVVATFASVALGTAIDGRKYRSGSFTGTHTGLIFAQGSDPAGVMSIAVDRVTTSAATAEEKPFHTPVILKPGQAAVMEGGTVLTAARGVMWGWVRKAFPRELF